MTLAGKYLCTQVGSQHYAEPFNATTPRISAIPLHKAIKEATLCIGESVVPIEEVADGFVKVYIYPRVDDEESKPTIRFMRRDHLLKLLPLPLPNL
jgi:hypothetical protein